MVASRHLRTSFIKLLQAVVNAMDDTGFDGSLEPDGGYVELHALWLVGSTPARSSRIFRCARQAQGYLDPRPPCQSARSFPVLQLQAASSLAHLCLSV